MSQTWDSAFNNAPIASDKVGEGYLEIQKTRIAVQERLVKEHDFATTSGALSAHGQHKKGSAVSYIQADAPTLRPDGTTALNDSDN
jgi:hypothetical protein